MAAPDLETPRLDGAPRSRCDNTRWVCEHHLDRPFLGERACGCGGAGAPCPNCNKADPTDPDHVPAMPPGCPILVSASTDGRAAACGLAQALLMPLGTSF